MWSRCRPPSSCAPVYFPDTTARRDAFVPSPPVIIQSAPARSDHENALKTGIALLYGAGGASPAWQVWFSFEHLWNRRLGIAFDSVRRSVVAR